MKIQNIFLLLFVLTTFCCCKNRDNNNNVDSKKIREVYSEMNYSDSLIDRSQFDLFYKSIQADSSLIRNVNSFYSDRDYQMAWNVDGELTAPADNLYERILEHMYAERDSHRLFVRLHETWNAPKRHVPPGMEAPVHIDLLLTASYFKYAEKTYSGKVNNLGRLEWYIPKKKRDYAGMLDALLEGNTEEEPLQNNNYYHNLKQNLVKYRGIQDAGGWPTIPVSVTSLKEKDSSRSLITLRKFLFLTGDMSKPDTTSAFFDNQVSNAVSNFQQRHGRDKTGMVDKYTLEEMNITVEKRIRQIMLNMERMQWFSPPDSATDFLMVNIPEFKLHVIEKGKHQWEMKVVVGTTANRTTVFKGNISQVVLNPYWNVPESIINNEMLDKLKANADKYITSQNMEVLHKNQPIRASKIDWADPEEVEKIRIRQLPGDANSLGRYKFLFPNSFSIYLHDSPAKSLFNTDVRSFSHGCIRVAEPDKLARYLLRHDKKWSQERMEETITTNKETFIKLQNALPVYIIYFTAWVDDQGRLNFTDDIYGHDLKLEREIYGKSKPIAKN